MLRKLIIYIVTQKFWEKNFKKNFLLLFLKFNSKLYVFCRFINFVKSVLIIFLIIKIKEFEISQNLKKHEI